MHPRLIRLAYSRCRRRTRGLGKAFGSSGAFALLHSAGGAQATQTSPVQSPSKTMKVEVESKTQATRAADAIDEMALPLYTLASPSQGTADFLKWWYATRLGGSFAGSEADGSASQDLESTRIQRALSQQALLDGSKTSRHKTHAKVPASTTPQDDSNTHAEPSTAVATHNDIKHKETEPSAKPTENHINELMSLGSLYEPIRRPRHPIVLLHGLGGFDKRGLFLGLEIHYWATVLDILRKKIGADVIVKAVPGAGSIKDRANTLHQFLCTPEAAVLGKKVNLVAHSMGGLDARHLITNIKPTEYEPISLTTLSTPHRGSPFMDWCNANVGVGNDAIEEAVQQARQSGALADSSHLPKVPYTLKTPIFVKPKKTKAKEEAKSEAEAESNAIDSRRSEGDQSNVELDPSFKEKVDEKLCEAVETVKATTQSAGVGNTADSDSAKTKTKTKGKPNEGKPGGISLPFSMSTFTNALSMLGGSFSSYMLSVLDQPAYAMLSTKYMTEVFNPSTPDSPHVQYYSVAARTRSIQPWHPLWLPKLILDAAAESRTGGAETDGSGDALGGKLQGNDGLVSVQSARWGHFLGVIDGCDHWDLRGGGGPRWGAGEKINYATGKPWEGSTSGSERLDDAPKKAAKEEAAKTEGSSWIDINRLLDVFTKSKKEPKDNALVDRKARDTATASKAEDKEATDSDGNSKPASDGPSSFLEHYAAIAAPDDAGMPDTARPWHSSELASMSKDAAGAGDSGIVSEVAEWISERLPQRDERRRAQAERAADAQDALAEASRVTSQAAFAYLAGSNGEEHEPGHTEPARLTLASTPTWSEIRSAPPEAVLIGQPPPLPSPRSAGGSPTTESSGASASPRLKRDAQWEASLDQNAASRELRRELAWHRAERARRFAIQYPLSGDAALTDAAASMSSFPATSAVPNRRVPFASDSADLDWDAQAKRRPSKEASKKESEKEKRRQSDQLERFWLAVCLHLYQQGH
ncbi:E [Ceraceosorus bombacis]|uniref:E n=1 Tax=Ceraceosorus bombacis TaxID=401625 RepID=A0A0P1BNB8_9BASI|nr:E [Ceraceosorus bombacis] [Ceraceosorus bombacis]